MENGQPRITPVAATATAMPSLSKRNNPDEREIAYMEKELGKKPAKRTDVDMTPDSSLERWKIAQSKQIEDTNKHYKRKTEVFYNPTHLC